SSQQDIVNRSYITLGKEFYNVNKMNPPIDNDETFKTISKALEKIDQLKNDIQMIKGTEACPNCNAEIAKDAIYCSECGIKVGESVSAEDNIIQTKTCVHCGMITDVNAAFCTGCGEKLNIVE
ncbi:MAG: zinc ribbon domain-containing protein, partial [Anaerocolumna sp.]